MNFHSVDFLLFLAAVVPLFWTLSNRRVWRTLLLLGASYLFYGAYESWYLALIVGSTLLDYGCGAAIHAAREAGDRRRAKRFLLLSLGGNLGVLGFFKYTDWVVESLQRACDSLGLGVELWDERARLLPVEFLDPLTLQIVVPVGISFYTFQTLSYTIDIYRGRLGPARNLREFALFVAFFPQLVAGPIVRAVDFLPQLELRPRFDRGRLHEGLWRLTTGLLKKVAIADVIGAGLVDPVYAEPGEYAWWVHWIAIYGFSFQIYFDFSGYSDIAIGTAKLMGFDLPENFDLPYRARSVREFWRRWHMSLSFWVRDYIYFPLGGSRGSEAKVSRNLVITMLVIGIWHGASILWVIYGLLQGVTMILERWFQRLRRGEEFATTPGRSLAAWALTFHFTTFSCIFIRTDDLAHVGALLSDFGAVGLDRVDPWALAALAAGALTHYWPRAITEAAHGALLRLPTLVVGVLTGLVVGAVAVLVVGDTPYIYFQF